ncbi:uncharacterized protein [Fopius arisanus]|uniref:Uncharacterized protein n=1 Tax=Fopius arisanus TaxID=64838 RepID=A0A9R1U8K6_9HYME|nr:PREDICTED: uncharacterized protein LOC105272486 [Fopius arisanus]
MKFKGIAPTKTSNDEDTEDENGVIEHTPVSNLKYSKTAKNGGEKTANVDDRDDSNDDGVRNPGDGEIRRRNVHTNTHNQTGQGNLPNPLGPIANNRQREASPVPSDNNEHRQHPPNVQNQNERRAARDVLNPQDWLALRNLLKQNLRHQRQAVQDDEEAMFL